jgi:hypothetical protein
MLIKITESIYVWNEHDWNYFTIALYFILFLSIGFFIFSFIGQSHSSIKKIVWGYISIAFLVTTYFNHLSPPKISKLTIDSFNKKVAIEDNYSKKPFELEFADFAFYTLIKNNPKTSSSTNSKIKYSYQLTIHTKQGDSLDLFKSGDKDITISALEEIQKILPLPVIDLTDKKQFIFPKEGFHSYNQDFPPKNSLDEFDRIQKKDNEYIWNTRIHPALIFGIFCTLPILFYVFYNIKEDGFSGGNIFILILVLFINVGFGFALISRINSVNKLTINNNKLSFHTTGINRGLEQVDKDISSILSMDNSLNSPTISVFIGNPLNKIEELSPKVDREFLRNISSFSPDLQVIFLSIYYEKSIEDLNTVLSIVRNFRQSITIEVEDLSLVDRMKLTRIIKKTNKNAN